MTAHQGWPERERRKENHDLLERIHALEKQIGILITITESERGNITHLIDEAVKAIKDHGTEDKEAFDALDKRVRVLERVSWMALGIVVFIEVISKVPFNVLVR